MAHLITSIATQLQSIRKNSLMHCTLTTHNTTKFRGQSALYVDSNSVLKDINTAKIEDLQSIHTQGHWVRDMRAVSYLYQWLDRINAWLPASGLGVTALIVAVAGISSTAVIATLGTAAIILPLIGTVVTAKAWAERESNKNQFEKRLTNEFRNQRSALLTRKSEQDGHTKINEFSRYTTAMNNYIFKAIQENVNSVLETLDQVAMKPHEFNLAFELLIGGEKNTALTPIQAKLFRERIPAFIVALRALIVKNNPQSISQHQSKFINFEQIKKDLVAQGFIQILPLKYSENIKNLQCLHILEPIELNEEEFTKLKNGETIYSPKMNSHVIDQILSVKKINYLDTNGQKKIQYRLYATTRIDLWQTDKPHEPTQLNTDQQTLFENQVKRAMLACAETTWAGHGTDSLVGIFKALSDPQSKLYQPTLRDEIIEGNHYLENWGLHLKSLTGTSPRLTDIQRLETQLPNLYFIDLMTQMSQDEYDFLLLERTGSRSPFSTGGQQPHFIKKARHIQQNLQKKKHTAGKEPGAFNTEGINLPFADKLEFTSTHCAPFHSHEYFLKLHALDMVDYQGVNINDHFIATPLSRQAMIKIYEDKQFQHQQCYSEHGFSQASFTKRRAGFGPAENNNSKSIMSSIKRYNSSRDLLIALASLHKKDISGSTFKAFDFNDETEQCDQVSWNTDPILRQMTHAMNISMLHNETRKLEAAIHDLRCIVLEYTQLQGACSLSQERHKRNQLTLSPVNTMTGSHTTSYLDTVIFQKKIKVLTSEVANQMNNLFKTQIDYQIAYGYDKRVGESEGKSKFTEQQQNEINLIFSSLQQLTQSPCLKAIFRRTHLTVAHHRNRFGGGGLLNGFRGRARSPFGKRLTFRGTMEKLLTQDIRHGLETFEQALKDVTLHRFRMEEAITEHSETLKNMQYIESLAL